jgi:epoxyqueuosine reductase QueG
MKADWNVVRKPENMNVPEWELEKSPEMQFRRELTLLYQEAAFQQHIPLYGVVSMDALENPSDIQELTRVLPGAKAAILFGASIEDPFHRLWHRVPGISMQNFTTIATSKIEIMLLTFIDKLETQGYQAISIQMPLTPSNQFTRIFELAGAGFTGKNKLVITRSHGCRVSLGIIITDAPLLHGDYRYEPYNKNLCGDCTLCQEYCPSGALKNGQYNKKICEEYINNPENQLSFSEHTILKCDMCMRICPLGEIGKWDSQPVDWNTILKEKKINF